MGWKPKANSRQATLEYLDKRRKGLITSFVTPWDKINRATVDGFEWGTTNVIGGRSGNAKTLIKDQLIREGIVLNGYKPGEIRILDLNFDMSDLQSGIRELSADLGLTYRELCSAGGVLLTDDQMKDCYASMAGNNSYTCDVYKSDGDDEVPPTVDEYRTLVIAYMNAHKRPDGSFTPTIVAVDHMYLFSTCSKYKNKTEMLQALCEVTNQLKKKYGLAIMFIYLNQLLREVDHPDRNENGSNANFPTASDLFGGDSVYQLADFLGLTKIPAKNNITEYGAEKYIIDSDKIIAFHILKTRVNSPGLCFFEAEFEHMRMKDANTPGKKTKK